MPQCPSCLTPIPDGARTCHGCGAEQTQGGVSAQREIRQARATVERTRILAVVSTIVAFGLGLGLGTLRTPEQAPVREAMPSADQVAELPLEHVNDLFLRTLNETLSLGVTSWMWGADSTLVLEIQPPSAAQPRVLWQELSPAERQQMTGYIGVQYTRSLLAVGRTVALAERGHPPVALRYRDRPEALAIRRRNGQVEVFASPFDGSGS